MELLERLRKISSKHQKKLCLDKASNLELAVFAYALDPYKIYHLKNFDIVEFNEGEPTLEMFNLLDDISNGYIKGVRARMAVNNFASENGNLIKRICQKNLRCGVSAKTINAVWPKLIPMFEVQLAKEVPLNTIEYPKLVQIKYDGVRLITIKKDNEVKFRTRNGKEVNLPMLSQAIKKYTHDVVLDGEIVISSGKLKDRTKVSGMINSAIHGGIIDESLLVYNIFDAMSIDHWENMECPIKYHHRLDKVIWIVAAIDSDLINVAFTFNAENRSHLENSYNKFIQLGYEGLILKDKNHLYSFKRSKDWIKLKETKTVDLICTATIEGEGKYEGLIGALSCEGKVENENIYVQVGSGLTDSDRSLPSSAFINETIEIKYNSIIQNKHDGLYSLFLPRFVSIRYDK